MRRSLQGIIAAGILGAVAYWVWRAWTAQAAAEPVPVAAEPHDDGSCPASYPIKAKLTSGIYHAPGGLNYERTKADRCYADGDAAEADGLRASKV